MPQLVFGQNDGLELVRHGLARRGCFSARIGVQFDHTFSGLRWRKNETPFTDRRPRGFAYAGRVCS